MSFTGLRIGWAYLAIGLSIAMALFSTPWTFAEEAIPEDPGVPVVLENPAPSANPVPTDPPVSNPPVVPAPEKPPVAEPPSVPEPEPTAEPIVEPTAAPDAPIVPVPVETAPAATEEVQPEVAPEPTSTPTPSPTTEPSPSPTPEPTPVVTWSQTKPVSCELRDGKAAGLKYAESRTYRCEVTANVTSDLDMPDDMEIEWTLGVSFPDTYALQFPRGSQARVIQRVPDGASTKYTIAHPWQQGDEQKLAFEIVITRNTCAIGEQVLSIQASPEIETTESDAEINRTGESLHPAEFSTEYLPNLEAPDVSMTPVDFGSIQWNGTAYDPARVTNTVAVTNHHPCATSQPHTVQLVITSDQPGLMPELVGMDALGSDMSPVDGSEEAIAVIPAGFVGTSSFELELELAPANDVPVGSYTFGIEVSVSAAP